MARHHFVEHEANRVHIAADVRVLSKQFLRRDILRSPDHLGKLRERQPPRSELGRHAHVDQLDLVVLANQDVFGLEVAKNYSRGCGCIQQSRRSIRRSESPVPAPVFPSPVGRAEKSLRTIPGPDRNGPSRVSLPCFSISLIRPGMIERLVDLFFSLKPLGENRIGFDFGIGDNEATGRFVSTSVARNVVAARPWATTLSIR